MTSKGMSLKGRINHYAKKNGIVAQVVLQNYMFERFLERLARSEYRQKFVIKGGMLVAAIVGMDTRSTMDLDTTLRHLPLSEQQIRETITAICNIPVDDDVRFNWVSIAPIRQDDVYGGYRVRLDAEYDAILTPLSIDISTGDIITPNPVTYELHGMINSDLHIPLWGYNVETILAEKVETTLRRGVLSTRSRDFYDVFILEKTQEYQPALFREALQATAEHRGSTAILRDINPIIARLENSQDLKRQWTGYQRQFPYAAQIEYDALMDSLRRILSFGKEAMPNISLAEYIGEMKRCLAAQKERYPEMTEEDVVKFAFQGMLGVGHLIASEADALAWLQKEMESVEADPEEPLEEKISPDWLRVNLRAAKARGIPAEELAARLCRSAEKEVPFTRQDVYDFCAAVDGSPAMRAAAARVLDENWLPRHSETYRKAYAPAYRVTRRDCF